MGRDRGDPDGIAPCLQSRRARRIVATFLTCLAPRQNTPAGDLLFRDRNIPTSRPASGPYFYAPISRLSRRRNLDRLVVFTSWSDTFDASRFLTGRTLA